MWLLVKAAVAGVLGTTGTVDQTAAPVSAELDVFESTSASVWDEAVDLVLPADVPVDISQPGTYDLSRIDSPGVIPAGTMVSAHFVHADPPTTGTYVGSITFDGPILGLQIRHDTQEPWDATFNVAGVVFETSGTLRDFNTWVGDGVTIDPLDPSVLRLDHDVGSGIDSIRVLVGRGPVLSVTGTCPGTVDITASRFLGPQAAFVSSAAPGATPVPGGPCAGGAPIALDAPITLRALVPVPPASATIGLSPALGAPACGQYLQVWDLGTCEPSNVVQLP
jgi:hypothetical protein